MSALDYIFNNKSTKNKGISRNRQHFERIRYFNSACQALLFIENNQQTKIQDINEAHERMLKSDAKYRFSIDMASLTSE
jgi:D-arabinose 1-dehydrogenase-like Zn-dependent alcohol dehydrogenase